MPPLSPSDIMYFLDYSSPPLSPEALTAILELCFRESDCFSLTYCGLPGHTNELITELFPHRCGKVNTSRWFCYITLADNPIERFLYPASSDTMGILKKHYTGLFLDNVYDKSSEYKQSLEDLCFFRENKLIMGTVSHEKMCSVYPTDEDFSSRLLQCFGHWMFRNDDGEQICLSDYTRLQPRLRKHTEKP